MFVIPRLADLVGRLRSAFFVNIPGADARLPGNNLEPTANVFGGALYELFGRLDWVGDQIFVTTASSPYLERRGADYGLVRKPATVAAGVLHLTLTDALYVAPGAVFQRADGVAFVATFESDGVGIEGVIAVNVVSALAGAIANTLPTTPMTIISGVTGPGASSATAAADGSGLSGGADLEDLEPFRQRVLFRLQNPPNGGCPADYVRWVSALPGVTRVFVERRWSGVGTVRVFPIFDGLFAGGVGDSGAIAAVQAALDPITPSDAGVTVAAPVATTIDIVINNLTPATTDVKAAVAAELADAFRRYGQVAGGDSPSPGMPFLAVPFTFSQSWIWQAIANATGEVRHQLTTPSADVSISAGHIPVLGSITYTP